MASADERAFRKLWKWADRRREKLRWFATMNENDPSAGPYFVLPNVTGAAAGVALRPKDGDWLVSYQERTELQSVRVASQADPPERVVLALAHLLASVAERIHPFEAALAQEYAAEAMMLAQYLGDRELVNTLRPIVP